MDKQKYRKGVNDRDARLFGKRIKVCEEMSSTNSTKSRRRLRPDKLKSGNTWHKNRSQHRNVSSCSDWAVYTPTPNLLYTSPHSLFHLFIERAMEQQLLQLLIGLLSPCSWYLVPFPFPFLPLSVDTRILGKAMSWTNAPPWEHWLPSCIYRRNPYGSGTLSKGTTHCARSARSESSGTGTFF